MSDRCDIVGFSRGVTSAVTAWLVAQEHPETTVLLFHDAKEEDPDNDRFGAEVSAYIGLPITDYSDGRSVTELFRDEGMLGNGGRTFCSRVLKQERSWAFCKARVAEGNAVTLYLGYTADELDRWSRARQRYDAIGVRVEAPLVRKGWGKAECMERVRDCWGIRLPAAYEHYQNANCFSGDTRFLTSEGTKELRECVGKRVRVLGHGGGWTEATVLSFGPQPLRKLTVSRNGRKKIVFTTGAHRWFAYKSAHLRRKGTTLELTTDALRPGMTLKSMYGGGIARFRSSPFGIAAGLTFGDGTSPKGQVSPASVTLCGDKSELVKWFPNSEVKDVPGVGVNVRDLPRFFKSPPPLCESKSYLLGWLSGYFAADGCIDADGCATLGSANESHLQIARDVAVKIGIPTYPIRRTLRDGFRDAPTPLFSLPFPVGCLPDGFFLLEKHRSRNRQRIAPIDSWVVESVEATDRVEEVFCAVVPDGAAFTLEDNLFTGNCKGCVKGGLAYWGQVYLYDRAVWEQRADLEDEFQHSILHSRYGGYPQGSLRAMLPKCLELAAQWRAKKAANSPSLFRLIDQPCGCLS